MKASVIVTALALLFPITAFSEVDPFAAAPEPPRPERVIERLPKSITYREVKDGQHEYVITGIYATSPKHDIDDPGSLLGEPLIPDCLTCTFDFKNLTCTFTTSRKLTYSELAYALDDIAKLGGDMPYWVELEARDLETTKEYAQISYTVVPTDQEPPAELAGFWVPKDKAFKIPLGIGGYEHGSLLVVPTSAFCMCHSKFSLRVLDPEGKVIWKEEGTAYAGVKIALSNATELGMHKIWLARNDHGESKFFLISPNLKEE